MQYKIVNLRVKNFKCFDNAQFYEFRIEYEKNPIILSGPNGFGKTTFFDAIELIFSKNITRLDKGIEKKTTNLGKNILLNKANEDGYVVLTLRNEQSDCLTIFAKILNNNHKLEVEDSIYYGEISGFISTEELDSFLCSYDDWKDSVDSENLIKYRAKNFNVYYYVSQAESVHFLKRTISDRKNAMNVLLNTGFIDDRKKVVIDLIGNRNGTSGHLINDEIMTLDNELKKKAAILKALSKSNMQDEVEKIEYEDLGLQVMTNLIEAYDLLMEFVSKHTSDKFCLIDNVNTSIRGIIAREVIGNILVHRDYSSAFPAKVIIEKDWLKTENWCIPRRHGNIMSDEFTPYPKNPLIQQFFANIGRTDTIGSGVRNLYKYTPIYSDGGKPELIEDDVFRITIPLDKMAAYEAREQKILSEREQKIYNMICENIHLSVEQVMAELDISRATVFRDYAKIKKVTGAMYDKKTSTWTL